MSDVLKFKSFVKLNISKTDLNTDRETVKFESLVKRNSFQAKRLLTRSKSEKYN